MTINISRGRATEYGVNSVISFKISLRLIFYNGGNKDQGADDKKLCSPTAPSPHTRSFVWQLIRVARAFNIFFNV